MERTAESSPDVIRLDWGWPAPELQATQSLQEILAEVGTKNGFHDAVFYGQREGNPLERQTLAQALSLAGPAEVQPDCLILTSGAGVGLDLILGSHASPSRVCFTQALTYHNALGIIRDRGFSTVPLAESDDGTLDFQVIEEQFRTHSGALCYLIPAFSNPCATTLSDIERERLVSLATRYNILIVADEVYNLLTFGDWVPQSLASLDPSGANVVSIGSFTKLAGPGLRLGWLEFGCSSSKSVLAQRILNRSVVVNGGCLNQFSAWVVGQWLRAGHFLPHLEGVRKTLATRARVLTESLRLNLDAAQVDIREAEGGYFVWLTLQQTRASNVVDELKQYGVGVRPAAAFRCHKTVACNGFRLSFSYYDEATLEEGARRLGQYLCSTS